MWALREALQASSCHHRAGTELTLLPTPIRWGVQKGDRATARQDVKQSRGRLCEASGGEA